MLIVSQYTANPPGVLPEHGQRIKIAGPLYDLATVAGIANRNNNLFLWTRKCISDARDLYENVSDLYESDHEMAACFIAELTTHGIYKNSEWCHNGKVHKELGPMIAACDAYELTRREFNRNSQKMMDAKYYLKFCINKSGSVVLLVSCHVSH